MAMGCSLYSCCFLQPKHLHLWSLPSWKLSFLPSSRTNRMHRVSCQCPPLNRIAPRNQPSCQPVASQPSPALHLDGQLETLDLIATGALGEHPDEQHLWEVAELDVKRLAAAACAVRDRSSYPDFITFSPKVFIPLTRACRDSCGYCTFALAPQPGRPIYMTVEEVLQIARKGAEAGCTEALFTLGDKPELLYSRAKEELVGLGHLTTISYVAEVAKIVLEETGLLPHINAGITSKAEIALLRHVSASQGLMLESISERLLEPGGAHFKCPDKVPCIRISMIAAAGEEMVPFTSGLLIGIGETRAERIRALLELRALHKQYGHIQELIIQNFRAKMGTRMEKSIEPSVEELRWTIAMARLAFGPSMNIQAPPNLTPELDFYLNGKAWTDLIEAGINDWGGISPVTKDWVNPEAPWPHLAYLAMATFEAGKLLVPRLPVYPMHIQRASTWLDSGVLKWVLGSANSMGFARGDDWSPGIDSEDQFLPQGFYLSKFDVSECFIDKTRANDAGVHGGNVEKRQDTACEKVDGKLNPRILVSVDGTLPFPLTADRRASSNMGLQNILQAAMAGVDLSEYDIKRLFQSVGPDVNEICAAADELRSHVNGNKVTYIVNRNINYTNICSYKCQFCAFSKGKSNEVLRGKPYRLSLEEIARRVKEAWDRGATEVCMQGGIHPEYTGETYLEIIRTVKATIPEMHIHAFSPLEVSQGASTLGISVGDFLLELKKAGLGSLPGTAAEILDDEVRNLLCPDKINTQQWLEVMESAHCIGLRSTSTIMFGHVDGPQNWARHLLHIRNLQKRTGGFTEFVPLPFVHMEAPIYLKGRCRKGPTRRETILMHAIARLALHPFITNIQASWVKMGLTGAQSLLMVGCNDMGGSLMNESITRAAGASHGEEIPPHDMEKLIGSIGRIAQQRTTLYESAPQKQVLKSFTASPLSSTNH